MDTISISNHYQLYNLSTYFSLGIISVTELPEDRNLQVQVIIDIHLNPDSNRPAELMDQFKEK